MSCRNPQNDARRSDRPRTADLRPRSWRAEHSCATALESVASLPEPARLLGSAVKKGSAVYERLGGGVEITRVPEVHQPVPACPRLLPLREPVGLGLGACSELPRRSTPARSCVPLPPLPPPPQPPPPPPSRPPLPPPPRLRSGRPVCRCRMEPTRRAQGSGGTPRESSPGGAASRLALVPRRPRVGPWAQGWGSELGAPGRGLALVHDHALRFRTGWAQSV